MGKITIKEALALSRNTLLVAEEERRANAERDVLMDSLLYTQDEMDSAIKEAEQRGRELERQKILGETEKDL